MEILSSSDSDLQRAAAALVAGKLVAFPTETVYGLGADAFNLSALARIFEAKNRPRFDPLIIHIAEYDALSRIADIGAMDGSGRELLSILAEKLWPGPLTLILPKRAEVPDLATAGLPNAAVRFPSHPVAQKLIRLSTGAVAAPSANPFGYLSPTRAEHVKTQLGEKVDIIVEGGKATVGVESTVLDLSRLSHSSPRILRPGGTPREAIEALIGPIEIAETAEQALNHAKKSVHEIDAAQLSPGQLKSHYAPRTPLIICSREEIDAAAPRENEGRLYFSSPRTDTNSEPQPEFRQESLTDPRTRVLSVTGNTTEAAANLFDMLHQLDGLGLKLIRAEEAPNSGLGLAINDRLRRAEKGK